MTHEREGITASIKHHLDAATVAVDRELKLQHLDTAKRLLAELEREIVMEKGSGVV